MKRPSAIAAPGLAFILVSIVLDMMAGNLAGPVFPKLVRSISGFDAAGVSELFGAFMTVFFLIQLFAGPIQGALSDRYGRRIVILASSFGLAIDCWIIALAPNLTWLFAGRILAGAMSGGFAAAFAYVADITPAEHRARRFGYVTAATSAGLAIGPVIGGFLGEYNARAPFCVAGVLGMVSWLYGWLVLPESLPAGRRTPIRLHNLHPLGVIAGMWREFPQLRRFGFGFLLLNFGVSGVNSIFAVYTTYRFGWGPKEIGFYITAISLENVLVQSFAVGPVVRRFGNGRAMMLGMAIQTLAMFFAGLAFTGLEFYLAIIVMILGGFAGPAQSAILNTFVAPEERGRLSGAMRSLFALASVLAPAVFSTIFAATGGRAAHVFSAGMAFFVATSMMVASAFVLAPAVLKPAPAPDARAGLAAD